ncbi:uncharacterized protein CIMG_11966 [Coccidioides immitis RS]|uniref:Uncharacterized protein n=1 Tax=Coccidioides immitis (strain RS) TaxID=246410 RepID=A0A0D8JXD6_COCIM|nr:uncharacterized protein CIMG_11966 [Coccidioides immitis RS]KJF60938.1 hypothetical protein CIMG_11966 [Coccidioides immitis RS]
METKGTAALVVPIFAASEKLSKPEECRTGGEDVKRMKSCDCAKSPPITLQRLPC